MSITREPRPAVSSEIETPAPSRRFPRWLAWTMAVALFLVAVFYVGGGWYFSNMIHKKALDAEERLASMAPDYDYTVITEGAGSISLQIPPEDDQVTLPGVWGIRSTGGYGLAGPIISTGNEEVVRSYEHLTGTVPAPGNLIAFEERAFPDDLTVLLGTDATRVSVPGPLGDYPALFFDGENTTWVILIHGYGMDPMENARYLPALLDEGYPALLITIRNDPGAPQDPSGMLRYGATEWEDLEAAVQYVLDQGAEDVALFGVSMGGGITASFLYESELATAVRAVVLDAPMLDFGEVVSYGASQEELPVVRVGVPASLTGVAKWLAGLRFGVDWDAVDYVQDADQLTVPILVFHGTADTRIPVTLSEQFAAERPDLIELVTVDGAPHMGDWNLDPDAFESRMLEFLATHTG